MQATSYKIELRIAWKDNALIDNRCSRDIFYCRHQYEIPSSIGVVSVFFLEQSMFLLNVTFIQFMQILHIVNRKQTMI